MKLLELNLLEIDYLKKIGNQHHIYLSGKIFKKKPIGDWSLYDEYGNLLKCSSYNDLFRSAEEKI
jgi:hypothetical protein